MFPNLITEFKNMHEKGMGNNTRNRHCGKPWKLSKDGSSEFWTKSHFPLPVHPSGYFMTQK